MKKRLLATALLPLSMFTLALAQAGHTKALPADAAQAVEVMRGGSQPSQKGPAENSIGSVRIDPLFPAREPSRAAGAGVTFEPGARTAWHTHPAGQTLVVTAGAGLGQQWGGAVQEIRAGDVVWIRPARSTGTGPRRRRV